MTLFELEKEVAKLPPDQLAKFLRWVKELDSDLWDKQIEADVAAGRLDDRRGRGWAHHATVIHKTTSKFWQHYHQLP